MSEGFYTVLRSDRPSSWKRPRADDLDSEGWSRRSSCLWEGCRRPGRLENGRGDYHPFCSSAHRDYHNADLFDMFKHGGAHVIKQPSGRCKLSGCDRSVWVIDSCTGEAYDFCRRRHSLMYKESMTEQWHLEGRLCKLNDCDNHIAVGKTSRKIHEYCCLDHLYSAAGARGKAAAKRRLLAAGDAGIGVCSLSPDPRIVEAAKTDGREGPSRRDELLQKSISQETPQQDLQAQIDKQQGYHEKVSMEAIKNCLRHLLENPGDFKGADPIGLFRRVPNVNDFHPWDEVTEFEGFRPRYFVHYIESALGKQQSTIERFHYKQTSRDHSNKSTGNVITRYFFYELKEKDYDGHSEAQLAFRKFEEDKSTGKLESGTKNRWKRHEFSLSDVVIDRKSPTKVPVISKIFQEKRGLPVWPRAKEVSNVNYEPVPVGTISQATFHTEKGMTSSHSSNVSPPAEGLAPGGGTLQGASSHSNKCEESNDFPFPQNTSMEVIANESHGSVPVEALGEEISHFGASGNSRNTSTPGGGLPAGRELLQGANANDTDEWNVFDAILDDTLMTRGMDAIANASNAESSIGTFPELGFRFEGRELMSSSSSNTSLGVGLPRMNLGGSLLDGFLDVGRDDMLSRYIEGNFPVEGHEATW